MWQEFRSALEFCLDENFGFLGRRSRELRFLSAFYTCNSGVIVEEVSLLKLKEILTSIQALSCAFVCLLKHLL